MALRIGLLLLSFGFPQLRDILINASRGIKNELRNPAPMTDPKCLRMFSFRTSRTDCRLFGILLYQLIVWTAMHKLTE